MNESINIVSSGNVEYRADEGRLITGPVNRYGDTARTKRGLERVAGMGSFMGLREDNLPVNLQHAIEPSQRITNVASGLLLFEDSPTMLRADLQVPEGDVGSQAIAGVQSGNLRGWSAEFVPIREQSDGKINTIYQGLLTGLGLVSFPAFRSSLVQLRRGGSGQFRYNVPIVTRDRGKRRKEAYRPTVFADTIESNIDVLLYFQSPSRGAIASTAAGTLILTDTPTALEFAVGDYPDTEVGRDLVALMESETLDMGVIPLITVPPPDIVPDAFEDLPEEGNPDVSIRWYRNVTLRGILITSSAGVNQDFSEVALRSRRLLAWL